MICKLCAMAGTLAVVARHEPARRVARGAPPATAEQIATRQSEIVQLHGECVKRGKTWCDCGHLPHRQALATP